MSSSAPNNSKRETIASSVQHWIGVEYCATKWSWVLVKNIKKCSNSRPYDFVHWLVANIFARLPRPWKTPHLRFSTRQQDSYGQGRLARAGITIFIVKIKLAWNNLLHIRVYSAGESFYILRFTAMYSITFDGFLRRY